MLEIIDLHASVDGTSLLKGVNFTVKKGEIHAVMGPNGAGKSTLAKVLAGHPAYEVTQGDIRINGVSVLEMEPDARAFAGLFMGFQYPVEIPGVGNIQFLQTALNAKHRKPKGLLK